MSEQTETTTGSTTSAPKRPLQDLATGDLNVMGLIALAGGLAALFSAIVYLCCMTYTLVHYRSWDGVAAWPAFFVSVILAVIALLSSVPLLIAQNECRSTVVGRCALWGTCLTLTGLQFAAAVLGDASLSLSAIVGMTAVIGIAGFAELAGYGAAES
ncbi:hypothetical protein OOK39_45950 [Streptomyces sp. NBC_00264]|nr:MULTISPECIES: hypothetical protein [unclassified Streptomyces]WSG48417.1 hypothetical protein OHA38_00320 [Streptomyces sp. NBC_01732]WSW99066.1 hypothetical protein OG355_00430 [Streptomyces sp. NBC_00987]MCX5166363.1 hypothetical protein [Streptomyces sp. NBC_00305]MCX5224880.1 hypothetical protein [Streptomyces sp. NBC_00264]RPK54213.1 hypothetical protein EES42_43470 [Streptomyces sp. ADI95-17]